MATVQRASRARATHEQPSIPPPTARELVRDVVADTVQRGGIRVMALTGEPLARLMTRGVQADPYPLYAELQQRGAVVRGKRISFPVVTTHELCYLVTRDPRMGVDNRVVSTYTPRTFPDGDPRQDLLHDHEMILRMDPPDHTRVRRLVSRAFTPRAVESLRPRVERIAHDLLDRVVPDGRMDLVSSYATELPILVIGDLLGVPAEDRRPFRHWGDDVAKTLGMTVSRADVRRAQAGEIRLMHYFESLSADHRATPRDDLLSALLAAEEDGDRLSHRELLATCILLLLAGFETTMNLISNGTAALMQNRDQLDELTAHPDLMPNAVEELLRYDSPVQFTSRNALEDVELAGVTITKGEQLGVMIGAANNDPAVFPAPRRLDIRRENAGQHLAFSSGQHFCLGAALARLEGEVAFTALLERVTDLRPAGRAVRRRNELLRGYERLPVAFRAA